jgi:hypothetical protein
MVFRLGRNITNAGEAGDPTPPTLNEQAYLQKALDAKKGGPAAGDKYMGYILPPWPQRRQDDE